MRSISSKPDMPGQPQVEHHAVVRRGIERLQRDLAGRDARRLDVAIADQIGDRLALDRIVLDDEQLLDALLDERLDPVEPGLEALGADRLVQEAERAGLQAAALLVEARDRRAPGCAASPDRA